MSKFGPERTNLYFTRLIQIDEPEKTFEEIGIAIKETVNSSNLEKGRNREGYEMIDISPDTESRKLNEVLKGLHAIRYIRERPVNTTRWFRAIEGKEIGILRKGRPAFFDTVDLVWYYPHVVTMRGAEEFVNYAYGELRNILGLPAKPEYISFTPYFLLWMLLKYLEDEHEIGPNISLEKVTSMKAIGIPELSGEEISIENVDRIFKSIPATSVLLDGLGLSELKGHFLLDGKINLVARAYSYGGLWVYIDNYLKRSSLLDERLGASVLLTERLFTAYEKWNKLPKSDREPDEEKYESLAKHALELIDERLKKGKRIRSKARRQRKS